MSDEKRYTERKMVMAQREAFVMGAAGQRIAMREGISCWSASIEAAGRYHLPKVTRPRVAKDPHPEFEQTWRCVDGMLQWSNGANHQVQLAAWSPRGAVPTDITAITPERLALWADLLANPTEEVEDEG